MCLVGFLEILDMSAPSNGVCRYYTNRRRVFSFFAAKTSEQVDRLLLFLK